jgi:hypothetical protein
MKKITLSIFIGLFICLFTNNIYSQSGGSKEYPNPSPEKVVGIPIKNPNATDLTVQGIFIDKRIVKYYPAGEIEQMSVEKLKALNHIYLDGFEMLYSPDLLNSCKDKIKKEFDLGDYNIIRKQDSRVETDVIFRGCVFRISLYSWDEIKKMKN